MTSTLIGRDGFASAPGVESSDKAIITLRVKRMKSTYLVRM